MKSSSALGPEQSRTTQGRSRSTTGKRWEGFERALRRLEERLKGTVGKYEEITRIPWEGSGRIGWVQEPRSSCVSSWWAPAGMVPQAAARRFSHTIRQQRSSFVETLCTSTCRMPRMIQERGNLPEPEPAILLRLSI
eukprot:6197805-Pleurochrysis_carterae.AAC.6